jgi:hypothetical protein
MKKLTLLRSGFRSDEGAVVQTFVNPVYLLISSTIAGGC